MEFLSWQSYKKPVDQKTQEHTLRTTVSYHLLKSMSHKEVEGQHQLLKLFLACLGTIGLGSLLCVGGYWFLTTQSEFTTSTSPKHTYIVSLKGQNGRALVLPTEVRVDVLKMGQPFASDIWLHSARNAFDLSFESGFPLIRWPSDNLVEFYREQYFEKGSDLLKVRNSSAKTVKYLRLQSVNKFLLFDLEPTASISMEIPAPRGGFQWIAVEGVFSDGELIPFNQKSFERRSTQRQRFDYQIQITSTGSKINSVEP